MFPSRLKGMILVVFLAFSVATSFADVVKIPSTKGWEGIWYDSKGGVISISEKDGFFDILGKDVASIYSCTGIIEANSANCFGSGINHASNFKFLYKNKMILTKDMQRIEEEWQLIGVGGNKAEGKTIFSRELPQSTR